MGGKGGVGGGWLWVDPVTSCAHGAVLLGLGNVKTVSI